MPLRHLLAQQRVILSIDGISGEAIAGADAHVAHTSFSNCDAECSTLMQDFLVKAARQQEPIYCNHLRSAALVTAFALLDVQLQQVPICSTKAVKTAVNTSIALSGATDVAFEASSEVLTQLCQKRDKLSGTVAELNTAMTIASVTPNSSGHKEPHDAHEDMVRSAAHCCHQDEQQQQQQQQSGQDNLQCHAWGAGAGDSVAPAHSYAVSLQQPFLKVPVSKQGTAAQSIPLPAPTALAGVELRSLCTAQPTTLDTIDRTLRRMSTGSWSVCCAAALFHAAGQQHPCAQPHLPAPLPALSNNRILPERAMLPLPSGMRSSSARHCVTLPCTAAPSEAMSEWSDLFRALCESQSGCTSSLEGGICAPMSLWEELRSSNGLGVATTCSVSNVQEQAAFCQAATATPLAAAVRVGVRQGATPRPCLQMTGGCGGFGEGRCCCATAPVGSAAGWQDSMPLVPCAHLQAVQRVGSVPVARGRSGSVVRFCPGHVAAGEPEHAGTAKLHHRNVHLALLPSQGHMLLSSKGSSTQPSSYEACGDDCTPTEAARCSAPVCAVAPMPTAPEQLGMAPAADLCSAASKPQAAPCAGDAAAAIAAEASPTTSNAAPELGNGRHGPCCCGSTNAGSGGQCMDSGGADAKDNVPGKGGREDRHPTALLWLSLLAQSDDSAHVSAFAKPHPLLASSFLRESTLSLSALRHKGVPARRASSAAISNQGIPGLAVLKHSSCATTPSSRRESLEVGDSAATVGTEWRSSLRNRTSCNTASDAAHHLACVQPGPRSFATGGAGGSVAGSKATWSGTLASGSTANLPGNHSAGARCGPGNSCSASSGSSMRSGARRSSSSYAGSSAPGSSAGHERPHSAHPASGTVHLASSAPSGQSSNSTTAAGTGSTRAEGQVVHGGPRGGSNLELGGARGPGSSTHAARSVEGRSWALHHIDRPPQDALQAWEGATGGGSRGHVAPVLSTATLLAFKASDSSGVGGSSGGSEAVGVEVVHRGPLLVSMQLRSSCTAGRAGGGSSVSGEQGWLQHPAANSVYFMLDMCDSEASASRSELSMTLFKLDSSLPSLAAMPEEEDGKSSSSESEVVFSSEALAAAVLEETTPPERASAPTASAPSGSLPRGIEGLMELPLAQRRTVSLHGIDAAGRVTPPVTALRLRAHRQAGHRGCLGGAASPRSGGIGTGAPRRHDSTVSGVSSSPHGLMSLPSSTLARTASSLGYSLEAFALISHGSTAVADSASSSNATWYTTTTVTSEAQNNNINTNNVGGRSEVAGRRSLSVVHGVARTLSDIPMRVSMQLPPAMAAVSAAAGHPLAGGGGAGGPSSAASSDLGLLSNDSSTQLPLSNFMALVTHSSQGHLRHFAVDICERVAEEGSPNTSSEAGLALEPPAGEKAATAQPFAMAVCSTAVGSFCDHAAPGQSTCPAASMDDLAAWSPAAAAKGQPLGHPWGALGAGRLLGVPVANLDSAECPVIDQLNCPEGGSAACAQRGRGGAGKSAGPVRTHLAATLWGMLFERPASRTGAAVQHRVDKLAASAHNGTSSDMESGQPAMQVNQLQSGSGTRAARPGGCSVLGSCFGR